MKRLALLVLLTSSAAADDKPVRDQLAKNEFERSAFLAAEIAVRDRGVKKSWVNGHAHTMMKRVGNWAAVWLQVRADDDAWPSSQWCVFARMSAPNTDALGTTRDSFIPQKGGVVPCRTQPLGAELADLMARAGMPAK